MSVFKVDAKEYGEKHRYVDERADLNPFIKPRNGYRLNTDLRAGFENAVDSNQLNLALQYVKVIFENIQEAEDAQELEAEKAKANPSKSLAKTPAKVAVAEGE